jgi:hypothetical protein
MEDRDTKRELYEYMLGRQEVNSNRSSFFLGTFSIETTERYLGCKQHFQNAVNDSIGLEPGGS